jgi:hypothetical protein
MKKIIVLFFAVTSSLCIFLSCTKAKKENGEVINREQTKDTVVIKNMGEIAEYDKVPERVVVVGYENAEVMAKLGLADKIVGVTACMYTPNDCYPELYKNIENVQVLPSGRGRDVPGFETILSLNADMVYCLSYHLNDDYIAPMQTFKENNIHVYVPEGTYEKNASVESVFHDLENLGKIFKVEKKAEEVIDEYKTRLDAVQKKLVNEKPVDVFIFDYQDKAGIMTPGGIGFQNNLITLAGARNIFSDFDKDFDIATIEQILTRNPEYIIIVEYFHDNEAKEKIAYLESVPELAEVSAIKNKNYIILSGVGYFPSLHNADAIETIAQKLHPSLFK